jgi:hypothetical protein
VTSLLISDLFVILGALGRYPGEAPEVLNLA